MKQIKTKIKIAVIAMMGMSLGVKAQITTSEVTVKQTNNETFILGNLGIGTTNPATLLNVNVGNGGSNGTDGLRIGGLGNYGSLELGVDGKYDGMIRSYGNNLKYYAGHWKIKGNTATENHSHNWYTFKAGSSNWSTVKMRLNHDGNLGIGTINPSTRLDVNGIISSRSEIRSISSNPALLLNESDVTDKNWHLQVNGGDLKFYEVNDARNNWDKRMIIKSGSGNVAIYGKLESTEIKVTTSSTADFVFEKDYNLPTLKSIEKHIKEKKHLPEIASAKEMQKNGVNVGNFQIQLLQKIEELTLYTIDQEKKLKTQNSKIENQQNEIEELKVLVQKF